MNPKLRAFLEANGLRADATEQEAWKHYDELQGKGITFVGEIGQRSAPAGTPPPVPAAPPAPPAQPPALTVDDVKAAARALLLADIERRREITDRLQVAGLTDHDNGNFARSMLDNPDVTVDRAAALIFAEMKTRCTAIGDGVRSAMTIGRDSRDKMRAAVTDGLLLRSGHRLATPAAGSNEFRGRHMAEIARMLLEASGVSTRGLTNFDVVGRALSSGHSTDFPLILGALVNKNLLAAYDEWPATWTQFVARGDANDFKALYSLKLSGAPDLLGLNEDGEYQTAKFSEAGESYRVVTKGIKVPLSRQMIINDDLRAFTRIPRLFGSSARRMENAAVYSLITTNGAMSDGVALFHSSHKNLATTAAVPSSDSVGKGRAAMRTQTGLNGEPLNIIPAFILNPAALETNIEIFLTSASLPTAEMSSGVNNPWKGKLTQITEPLLDVNSTTAWYLLASPNQAPLIEVSWLQGQEQPYVEEQIDFNSDALVTKIRHDFGAGAVDPVGGYKNAGA